MLNALYPGIDWARVRAIGLDLDGTLYDEFDLIAQAYRPIAAMLASTLHAKEQQVYNRLVARWLEMGSSYPHIFSEVILELGIESETVFRIEDECVRMFRDVDPVLTLSPRVVFLLEWLYGRYPLFLLTDGQTELQRRKVRRLGLSRWFSESALVITGSLDPPLCKPSPNLAKYLPFGLTAGALSDVVYFGDRDVDAMWAKTMGCTFVRVRQMVPVGHTFPSVGDVSLRKGGDHGFSV